MEDYDKELSALERIIARKEKEIEKQKKEVARLTKAFIALETFYQEEKDLNQTYKNKLLSLGVVLL